MKTKFLVVLLAMIPVICLAGEQYTLSFQNTDVRDVLGFYAKLTGKKLVYDNTVQGPVTVVENTQVNADKAIELVEQTLFANNFSLVDLAPDTVEVLGLGRNARSIGVPCYKAGDEFPKGERIFSYVFKLRYRDPADIQKVLTAHAAPNNYTSVIIDPKIKAVVVTERTSVIRNWIKLVEQLDVPEQK